MPPWPEARKHVPFRMIELGVTFSIETERETDGRWIAEVVEIPGAMVYGSTQEEAIQRVQALALRVLADKLEHGESENFFDVSFRAA